MDFFCKTEVKSNMSGSTEPSQLLMPVKEEIKEEELDDFLQEHLSAIQKVEEKPGLEHDCKTEKSPSLTCKEENDPTMEIKEEEELDLREYGHDDSSPASKLLNSLYSSNLHYNSLQCVIYMYLN